MSQEQTQPIPSGAASGLDGRDRKTIRYAVSGGGVKREEFYGLDKARLHAWGLALEGHSVEIAKIVYDTMFSPMVQKGSAVLEAWDERSTFVLLNAELTKRR